MYRHITAIVDLSAIREKIGRGDLPREEWDYTHVIIGGFHSSCAACDSATTPVDLAVECHYGDKRVVLHPDCYVMWEEARRPET